MDIYNKTFQYVIRVFFVYFIITYNARWFDTQMPKKKYMFIIAIIFAIINGLRPKNLLDIFN